MECPLRCNDLRCRAQLHERAVVTTCSHVFCIQCSDSSGLSRAAGADRQCPACGTQMINQDDVVVTILNPTEDYKTSVLSGLSPSIIMDCATRALQFYTYQTSQEITYQEHLAKSLTDRYHTLNQQMDQVIHDANAQIRTQQEKMQSMQADQTALEEKNHELAQAYSEKYRAHAQVQKLYQALKAEVMVSQVADAAGNEADLALHTGRPDRFVDRIPGTRTGTANFSQRGTGLGGGVGVRTTGTTGRQHNRAGSGNSIERDRSQRINIGNSWGGHGFSTQRTTGLAPAAVGTPSQFQHRSRLPAIGSARPNSDAAGNVGSGYAPMGRRPLNNDAVSRNLGGLGFGAGAGASNRPGVGR